MTDKKVDQDSLVHELHVFDVDFKGPGDSRIWLDGLELQGVVDVVVHQGNGPPEITIHFLAGAIKGRQPQE